MLMSTHQLDGLKYPIGKFVAPQPIERATVESWITEIASFPGRVEGLTAQLGVTELNWRYRPDGWTIKQVVHHCADSHMNSLMRFKLALTEETPFIRPYQEDKWAELADSLDDNIEHTLSLIHGLHYRWVLLLKNLDDNDLDKQFVHPQHGKHFTLKETIGLYAWHGNHHLAHIRQALASDGKF